MTVAQNILVIDDEEPIRDSCHQILSKEGYQVDTTADGESGLKKIGKEAFGIVILDLRMPGLHGLDVLKTISEKFPSTVVIVITGYATIESAVKAMKLGAYDFLPKPFTPDELRFIVKRAGEKRELLLENIYLRYELEESLEPDIIGQSESMQQIVRMVRKVGPTDSTVLITGESGTGKELIAKAIRNHSARKNHPFITVDCGSLVESLFESELFGHVKGSFTGAIATKHGRFELANGGTIFFDEIGNIGTNIQAKLLRAIQEGEIIKVGSSQVIKVDIRIIAATNQDLRQLVNEGGFREDLFYRLSVVPIHLPPLRERPEDIPLLANLFLKKYSLNRKKEIQGITDSAMKALVRYRWPGNIRELENAIERAVVLSESKMIKPDDLLYYGFSVESDNTMTPDEPKSLEEIEKAHILEALRYFDGHRSQTAQTLGIDRKTLRLKMRRYGIE
ncbi:sigma-54-dependent transcriptional regulator [Candidatus Neomarinimicrobiota bacterium]